MANEEQARVGQAVGDYRQGNENLSELRWNEDTQMIEEVGGNDRGGEHMRYNIEKMGFGRE